MANGIDQSLLEAGRRGADFVQAPSLFDQTIPGLFSNLSTVPFDETQGGRFKKFFLGGLFGPTKAERAAFEREQTADAAALKRRSQGIAGQIRLAGKGDALSFPAVRDAVQAAALGEAQGLSDVAAIAGAQTGAQRAAGIRRQGVADLTAEETLRAAILESEGGRFGSGLDVGQFIKLKDKVGVQVAGASSLANIADTVENLTDFELAMAGPGFAGGTLQGQIEADLFGLLSSMQTLLEIGEPSVLRKSDQDLINAALGNPSELSSLLFSREPKTLATIRRFSELLLEGAERSLVGLDEKTIRLMSPVLQMAPRPFQRPEGPLAPAKGPTLSEIIAPGADPGAPTGRGPGGAAEAAVDRLLGGP
jgi:hypothetical protein